MDYSQNSYFAGAQPYQFIGGIGPLTPAHSNSVTSDEFNTTSPPEVFDQFPHGLPHDHQQFQQFDNYAQFNHQVFPGSSTPPNQHPGLHTAQQQAPQPQPQQQPQPQPQPLRTAQPIDGPDGVGVAKEERNDDRRQGQGQGQGSNSDDDDLTPAQSRRKAQNRAAQRAFRERKERHVKDLEAKLANLEASQTETVTENERLKRDLQKMSTENEILRATTSIQNSANGGSPNGHGSHGRNNGLAAMPTTTGPMSYNPTDFYSDLLANHTNKTPSHRVVTSDDGQRLLAAGATWEYIISHDLFKRGLVDVGDVSERLKRRAKCDGQGPVFEERAIIEAIEQSVASGSDELI